MLLQVFRRKSKARPSFNIHDEAYFSALRDREYARLDKNKQIYLDYTGGNLYARCQIADHQSILLDNVLGNPHSSNPTSQKSTNLVEDARAKVLQFFNASDYYCVFTQNATGALKIVGESYPFNENSALLLLSDNHNSVNGIREFCSAKGGMVKYVPVQYEDLKINDKALYAAMDEAEGKELKLLAFPAQSNVSGVKHDLSWIQIAQDRGFDVLLDAAAFVPTSKLDLSIVKPDFVSVSFYKIFGYPTGLGCLLVRKRTFHRLRKPWFAGGTVSLVSVTALRHFLATSHERYEEGTVNYLDIPAVKLGLDYIEKIGLARISARVRALAETLSHELGLIKHDNGKPLVRQFGPKTFDERGGTIIMNFFDPEGETIPIETIEKLANAHSISLRSGCFCNPGIDEINNCITTEELSRYFTSRDHGDYYEMIKLLGRMRGATRVSLGIATNSQDLATFLALIKTLRNKAAAEC
jgi:molybdenum cofactor sulfurtransferase